MLDEATAAAEAMTLAKRSVQEQEQRVLRRRRLPSADLEVVRTRAEPLGIEVRRRFGRGPDCDGRRLLRRAAAVPGDQRRACDDLRAAGRAGARAAGAPVIVAADLLALTLLTPPGELGADIVVGNDASASACRWASAARTPAYLAMPRRVQALAARPPGRRQRRRARQPGLPPGAADARAAHPPREGHVQHLHGAGAAGRDGQHVRGLPRPAGPAAHRAARAPATPPSWPTGLEQLGYAAAPTTTPSTR